ncbi:MAG: DUF2497 domain-containing protein [Kiloniellales bacterium]
MSERDREPEPSMEEILASIRRIISEDGEEKAGDEAKSGSDFEPEPDGPTPADEDVLELTEEIDQGESTMNDPPPLNRESGLVSPKTEAAAGAFAALGDSDPEIIAALKVGNGNRTLEDMVKEVLRPVIREWLDENLPKLVETLVEAEIRRLSGGPQN